MESLQNVPTGLSKRYDPMILIQCLKAGSPGRSKRIWSTSIDKSALRGLSVKLT